MLTSLEGVYAPTAEKFLAKCVKECQQALKEDSGYNIDDVVSDAVMDGLADLDGSSLLRIASELAVTPNELVDYLSDFEGEYYPAFIAACDEFLVSEVLRLLKKDISAEEEASFHEQVLTGSARRTSATGARTRKEPLADFKRDVGENFFEVKVTVEARITNLEVVQYLYPGEVQDSGELRIYFDGFDQSKSPSLYPSNTWLRFFREALIAQGFSSSAAQDVSWSESGMQGQNYASFDFGPVFLKEWDRMNKKYTKPGRPSGKSKVPAPYLGRR